MNVLFGRMKSVLMAFPILIAAFLSGCGSSGGSTAAATAPAVAASTIITGTAAAGAPIIGTVSIRDSSTNPQPVRTGIPIAADGKYSVDVASLKAPFAFLADGTVGGKRVQLYSAATQADVGGTINITPLTDLIVRNIAGTIATTLADAIGSKLSTLTAADLDAKRVDLTNKLTPVLQAAGVSTSIDLLRAAFTADGTDKTGLDRFMDLVKVDTTVPTAVTITNILDAAKPLTVNPATGIATGGTTLSATGVTTTATPVDGIKQTFNTFASLFATSLPSPTDPALLALFNTNFKDGGRSSAAFLTEMTTDKNVIGVKLANGVVVDSVDTVAGTAEVHFSPVNSAGVSLAHDMVGGAFSWQLTKVGTRWLLDGDQRIASVQVRTSADKLICNSGSSSGCTAGTVAYFTGLNFWIDDRAMTGIGSAVVTGPGLPAAGVTLTAQPNQTALQIPLAGCAGCTTSTYTMKDSDIGAMGTGPYAYTVKLYSMAATPVLLATYTEAVPVAPVRNTALAALAFPSISNTISLANYAGGTLTPAWTIPTGLWGDLVSVNVWQASAAPPGPNQFVRADLPTKTATSGTATLVITPPATGSWTNGNYSIMTWDQYAGKVNTSYQ